MSKLAHPFAGVAAQVSRKVYCFGVRLRLKNMLVQVTGIKARIMGPEDDNSQKVNTDIIIDLFGQFAAVWKEVFI